MRILPWPTPRGELFWERIQKLAANHGVFRVWTQERSPFWTSLGFQPPTAEILARLPDEWKNLAGGWLTLQLKNEEAITAALENQFAGFMDAEKKQTAQVAEQARKLRLFITVVWFSPSASSASPSPSSCCCSHPLTAPLTAR